MWESRYVVLIRHSRLTSSYTNTFQRAQSAIPRIQELNPRVNVKSDGSITDLLAKDESYYRPFDIVIACDHDFMNLSLINTAARFASRPFYAAGIHGFYGYIFADLLGHEFIVEREKSNRATAIGPESTTRSVINVTTKKESKGGTSEKTFEIVKKSEIYCPLILANSSPLPMDIATSRRKLKAVPALLPCLRALFDFERTYSHPFTVNSHNDLKSFTELATAKSRELQLPPETLRAEFLRSFIQNIGAEIVPTAAFVGGRLSEDVINVLGQREQPIQNFALFDGDVLEGRIYSLYSPPPEATLPMGMGMGLGVGMDGLDPLAGGGMMDMGMGMQGMPFDANMSMPLGDVGGMGMMMDGSMMDASGMVGMGNGMVDNAGFNVMGTMNVASENAVVPEATSGVVTADNGAANLAAAQDPPRSIPAGEGDATGS